MQNRPPSHLRIENISGIKWNLYSKQTIKNAQKQDKILFIYIQRFEGIIDRYDSAQLLSNPLVIETVNNDFFPILLDSEDAPEVTLLAFDTLSLSKNSYSFPLYLFLLPNLNPITCISSIFEGDFLRITNQLVKLNNTNREQLISAAELIKKYVDQTGTINTRAEIKPITENIIHLYAKTWLSKEDVLKYDPKKELFSFNPMIYIFFLKYFYKHNKIKELKELKNRLFEIYYSPLFDPIDGGFFSQSLSTAPKHPLYEKNLYVNCNAIILFSFAHKVYKDEIFKKIITKIISFINLRLKTEYCGYLNSTSIAFSSTKPINEAKCYKYSLNQIKELFPDKYNEISTALKLRKTNPSKSSEIHNTIALEKLSQQEIDNLQSIRNTDKIIKDMRVFLGDNCLFSTSLCIAANNIPEMASELIDMAEINMARILKNISKNNNTPYRYISSENEIIMESNLYDEAMFLNSLIRLYKLTNKDKYKILMEDEIDRIFKHYYHNKTGMFYTASIINRDPLFNKESNIDYQKRSDNSIMAKNLFMLSGITSSQEYQDALNQQLSNIASHLSGSGPLMCDWADLLVDYIPKKD